MSSSLVPTTTVSAVGLNITAVVAAEKAQQASSNANAPKYLMLGMLGLFLLCAFIQHPRFLARLFASLPQSLKSKKSKSFISSDTVERVVGGGGLFTGWVLQKGTAPQNQSTAEEFPQRHTPPQFFPPPNFQPPLSHLPFSNFFLFTPFSRLPKGFTSSVTLNQLYLIAGYLAIVLIGVIYRSDLTPTTSTKGSGNDFYRTGLIALTQVPIVIALGVRNNPVGLAVAKGYEKLKLFHKIVGRVLFLCATVHSVLFMNRWVASGSFSQRITTRVGAFGFIAWLAIVFIAVASLPWFRKRFYNVFQIAHVLGVIVLLVGLGFHNKTAEPYCIASGVIYGFSILASLSKTRITKAELIPIPSSGVTVIRIPGVRTGWRAGQHVRIRVPALGFPNSLEAHPFSIGSGPDDHGIVLMCKNAGGWTNQLFQLARNGVSDEKGPFGMQTKVIVEGPYGGLGNTMLPSFSSVVLVAGGSGITYTLSLAHDLVLRAKTGVVRPRVVDLVWVVKTEDIALPMMGTLNELVTSARRFELKCIRGRGKMEDYPEPVGLRVTIYITRHPSSSPLRISAARDPFEDDDPFVDEKKEKPLPTYPPTPADRVRQSYLARNPSSSSTSSTDNLSVQSQRHLALSEIIIHPSRPDFSSILDKVADEVITRHGRNMTNPSGICVTGCGPMGMVNDVRDAVRGLEGYKRRAVGGVDFEAEAFGF